MVRAPIRESVIDDTLASDSLAGTISIPLHFTNYNLRHAFDARYDAVVMT
jgi:hypothetical protein